MAQEDTSSLVKWGWITTILIAPVGAIIGIILLTKNRVGQGVAMLVVCALWFTVGWALTDAVFQGAETGEIESFIESDLAGQIDGAVRDVTCVRDSDSHATCYADVFEADLGQMNYSIDVSIDQNTGSYVWQVTG